jgi:hypothetical protein
VPHSVGAAHSPPRMPSDTPSPSNGTEPRGQLSDDTPWALADSWLGEAYSVEGPARPLVAELVAAHQGLIAGSGTLMVPRRDQ